MRDEIDEIRERWAGWQETTCPELRGYATWWWADGERVEARFWKPEGRALALYTPGDVRTLLAEIDRLRALAPRPDANEEE